jgi:hypothetical protein
MSKVFFAYNYDARLSEQVNNALEFVSTEQGLIELLSNTVLQSKDFAVLEHILKNRFSLLPPNDYDESIEQVFGDSDLEQLDFFGVPAGVKKERKKRITTLKKDEEQDELNFEEEGAVFPAVNSSKGLIEITENLIVKCSKEIALSYFTKTNHLNNFDDQYDLLIELLKKDAVEDISDLKLFYIADYIFDLFKK